MATDMRHALLIDTNLLVLLVVGLTNESYVGKHDCLADYDRTDWLLLKELISESLGVILTPHVLAETSNLMRQIKDPIKSEITRRLGRLINDAQEENVAGRIAVLRAEYVRLGITDTSLLSLIKKEVTLLTVDTGLYLAAISADLKALHFNHIRDQRPDFQVGR